MTLFPGTRLGPYEVVAPIGAGGMGEVYRAKDTRLDRTVAVKILPAHLSSSADSRQRFEREARTISQLSHPHICALEGERLVTDAEVFRELLHRYAAIQRLDAIEPTFEALLGVVDEVFPVDLPRVERAKSILLATAGLSARDALHLAVMEKQGVRRIASFDAGFDGYPGVERITA